MKSVVSFQCTKIVHLKKSSLQSWRRWGLVIINPILQMGKAGPSRSWPSQPGQSRCPDSPGQHPHWTGCEPRLGLAQEAQAPRVIAGSSRAYAEFSTRPSNCFLPLTLNSLSTWSPKTEKLRTPPLPPSQGMCSGQGLPVLVTDDAQIS